MARPTGALSIRDMADLVTHMERTLRAQDSTEQLTPTQRHTNNKIQCRDNVEPAAFT